MAVYSKGKYGDREAMGDALIILLLVFFFHCLVAKESEGMEIELQI